VSKETRLWLEEGFKRPTVLRTLSVHLFHETIRRKMLKCWPCLTKSMNYSKKAIRF